MSDIKFKISGNTEPFSVKLWNSGCSAIVQEKVVEYPDTCVILGNLEPITTYHLNIIDRVGRSISSGYTTPTALVPPVPVEKTITLLGTITGSQFDGSQYSHQLASPKYISIEPPLQAGECVDLCFDICTCDTSNTNNAISICCNSIVSKSSINNNCEAYVINMQNNDYICYSISSISTGTGEICGSSTLKLVGASSVGSIITPIIGTPSTQETSLSVSDIIFTLNPTAFNFDVVSIGETMDVESTYSWYVQTPYVDWLTIDPPYGSGDLTINIYPSPAVNRGIPRNTQITFVQNETGNLATIYVSQAGAPAVITVDPPTIFFGTGELTKNVLIGSSPYGWEIADMDNDKPDWVNLISPNSASDGEVSVDITVDAILHPLTRSGVIIFTQVGGDNITTSLDITQSNIISTSSTTLSPTEWLNLSPDAVSVPWNQTSQFTTINSSSDWVAVEPLPLGIVSINPSEGSSGTNINIIFEENETGDPRLMNVRFALESNNAIQDTIRIDQASM